MLNYSIFERFVKKLIFVHLAWNDDGARFPYAENGGQLWGILLQLTKVFYWKICKDLKLQWKPYESYRSIIVVW